MCSVCAKSLQSCLPFVTLWTVARQAPLSLGFSKQEYWGGLPFPSPIYTTEIGKHNKPELCWSERTPAGCLGQTVGVLTKPSLRQSFLHSLWQAKHPEFLRLPQKKSKWNCACGSQVFLSRSKYPASTWAALFALCGIKRKRLGNFFTLSYVLSSLQSCWKEGANLRC